MKRPSSLASKEHVRMSIPNNFQWPVIKRLQDTVIKFPYSLYPFPNQTITASLFNTILQCSITQQKINKIANLKCENVIGLKKIVKIRMKQKKSAESEHSNKSKSAVSTYSFYYQKVQYSLGHVFESKSKQHLSNANKFNLDRTQIKKTLANVIAALYKQGIVTFLEFKNIGINQKGVIKVYVAPNVMFDQHEYSPKTKVLVITYLNNVLKQIDAKFPKTLKNKHSLQSFKSKPDISIENDIIQSQDSFIIIQSPKKKPYEPILNNKIFITQEKSFNEDQDHFIGASGSTNLDHLKLQQQMKRKFQNHKLASKVQQNIQSQKKSRILTKIQQKNKIDQLSFQLQQMRRKIRQKAEEKREKNNIYASKGFKTQATEDRTHVRQLQSAQKDYRDNIQKVDRQRNHNNPVKKSGLSKKRKSSQSPINFYHGLIPNQKNINCINIYNPKHIPQKSYYQMLRDDAMSVDTYEMEIGDNYQMPKIGNLGMRSSLAPQQKVRQSFKGTPTGNKSSGNQKSRYSESMGGKSIGNLVNLLKPQFAPKKSNIFQEPQNENEQDSKNSTSLKKSIGKDSDLSIQKRLKNLASPRLVTGSSHANSNIETKHVKGLKTVEQFRRDLKRLMGCKMSSVSPDKQTIPNKSDLNSRLTLPISRSVHRNPEEQMMFLRQTEYRPKTSHKKPQAFMKRSDLEDKVRKAMQRTKVAISVLNSAKARQSGSRSKLSKGSFFQ